MQKLSEGAGTGFFFSLLHLLFQTSFFKLKHIFELLKQDVKTTGKVKICNHKIDTGQTHTRTHESVRLRRCWKTRKRNPALSWFSSTWIEQKRNCSQSSQICLEITENSHENNFFAEVIGPYDLLCLLIRGHFSDSS